MNKYRDMNDGFFYSVFFLLYRVEIHLYDFTFFCIFLLFNIYFIYTNKHPTSFTLPTLPLFRILPKPFLSRQQMYNVNTHKNPHSLLLSLFLYRYVIYVFRTYFMCYFILYFYIDRSFLVFLYFSFFNTHYKERIHMKNG